MTHYIVARNQLLTFDGHPCPPHTVRCNVLMKMKLRDAL